MPRLALATLAFGVVLTGGQLAGAQPARVTSFVDKPTPEQINFFEKKIRPVLVDSCYKCHSADAEKPKGELLLDTREGTRKGGFSGPSIVPGSPERSRLIQALHSRDPDTAMPP